MCAVNLPSGNGDHVRLGALGWWVRVSMWTWRRCSRQLTVRRAPWSRYGTVESPRSTAVRPSWGHEHLAATLTDFCARWSAGVDNLARDVEDIAGRLAECAREYESVDHTASEHLGDVFSCVNGDDPAGS